MKWWFGEQRSCSIVTTVALKVSELQTQAMELGFQRGQKPSRPTGQVPCFRAINCLQRAHFTPPTRISLFSRKVLLHIWFWVMFVSRLLSSRGESNSCCFFEPSHRQVHSITANYCHFSSVDLFLSLFTFHSANEEHNLHSYIVTFLKIQST